MINYKDEVKCWDNLKSDLKKVLKEKEDDKMKLAKKMVGMAISGIEKVITKHRKDELSDKDKEKGLTRLYFNLNNSKILEDQINVLMDGTGTGNNSGWDSDLKKIFKSLNDEVNKYKEKNKGNVKSVKDDSNKERTTINKIIDFMNSVSNIGEVGLNSENKIKEAESRYSQLDINNESLSEDQKNKIVENYKKLKDIRKKFEELKLIDAFVKSVMDIGKVDLGSEDKIKKAKECYQSLIEKELENRDEVTIKNKELVNAQKELEKIKSEIERFISSCKNKKENILRGYSWEELDVEVLKTDHYDKLTDEQKEKVKSEFDELYKLKEVYKFNFLTNKLLLCDVLEKEKEINEANEFCQNKLNDEQKKYDIVIKNKEKIKSYLKDIVDIKKNIEFFNKSVDEIGKKFGFDIEDEIEKAKKIYKNNYKIQKYVDNVYKRLIEYQKKFNFIKPAKIFIELVNAIGNIAKINLESEESIKKAEESYGKLDTKLKRRDDVNENYNKLVGVRKKLIELKIASFVKSVNDIGDIEKIGLKSEESIKKAEESYRKLDDEQRKQNEVMKKYEILVKAQDEFTAMNNISIFIESVKNIGDKVSLESRDKIDKAFLNYSKLNRNQEENEDVKKSVIELAKLKKALTVLEKPDKFIRLVGEIGEIEKINLSSEENIDKAEKAYNDLTDSQKKQQNITESKNKLDEGKKKVLELKNGIQEFEKSVKNIVENIDLNSESVVSEKIKEYENLTYEQRKDLDVDRSYKELLKAQQMIEKMKNPVDSFNKFVNDKLTKEITLESKYAIEQAKNDYEKFIRKNGKEQDVSESLKKLNEAEQKWITLNQNEQKMEKIKDKLKEIKNGLKDLNRFRSDKDGKFDEKTFHKRLLEGFWLCWENDEILQKSYGDKGKISEDLKVPLGENSAKILLKTSNVPNIANISKNYLLFMISMIKCKEQYIKLVDQKELVYKDPSNFLVKKEYSKIFEDSKYEIKKLKYEEKNLLNNLNDIDEIEIDYEVGDDKKSESQAIDRPNSDKISILRQAYNYLCPKSENKKNVPNFEGLKSDDENFDEEFAKLIEKVITNADESVKNNLLGKLVILKLKMIVNDIKKESSLKECKLPMWKIENNKPSVSRDDLHQGSLGDCWLISSLISIVDKDPDDILECFPNKDTEIDSDGKIKEGSNITVRLYRVMVHAHRKLNGRIRAYARPLCPVDIKMKSTIYKVGNKAKIAWPKFIEKAVSVYRSKKLAIVDDSLGNFGWKLLDNSLNLWTKKGEGHQALKSGYTDGIVMAMILGTTGGGTDYDYAINDETITDSFYEYLKKNLKNFKNKKATVAFRKKFEVGGKLIITKHAYSLDDVSDGSVTITNPWNSSDEGKKKWSNKVTIPFETFCKYCKDIESSSSRKKEKLVSIPE